MAIDFAQLKKNRSAASKSLEDKINEVKSKQKGGEDTRLWRPTTDKSGNGSAVIRFLPDPNDTSFVRLYEHAFQGPGGQWYIEKSLTTLNQKDPVSEMNTKLWNSGVEANKDIVRKRKRKTVFISNILVIKDPGNPDNEGQVRLFKYGTKIFDMITSAAMPEFDDMDKVNVFDMWEGADFKLRVRKLDGYPNYDKSEFATADAVGDDDEIKELWSKTVDLNEFIDAKSFKTYDELKGRLDLVLGGSEGSASTAQEAAEKPAKKVEIASKPKAAAPATVVSDDDEEETSVGSDDLDYLRSLAEEE